MQDTPHFPHLLLSGMRKSGDNAFLYTQHGKGFASLRRKDVASQVNLFARALHAAGTKPESRVAFYATPPSREYWVSDMAALSAGGTGVIVSGSYSPAECIGILAETHSKIVIAHTLAHAKALALEATGKTSVTHIICIEGKAPAPIPILDWQEFLDSGKTHPDQTAELMARIAPSDTAMLFYSKDEREHPKVARFTHKSLMEHARAVEGLLGKNNALQAQMVVLSSTSWSHPIDHIVSCYLPLMTGAAIQLHSDPGNFSCLENHPHVLVATAAYLARLRTHIETEVQASGKMEWRMFRKSMAYGKHKYEKGGKIGALRRLFDNALKATVVRNGAKILGGRLKLIIGVDDAASYDTELFFHTFGVELVEVPAEMFPEVS